MKIKELREWIALTDAAHDQCDVEVWLPGSRIILTANPGQTMRTGNTILIEGNVKPGTESWRFNRGEWQAKIAKMTDAELQKEHSHHLNYVPNSPVVHLTMAELKKRKLGY